MSISSSASLNPKCDIPDWFTRYPRIASDFHFATSQVDALSPSDVPRKIELIIDGGLAYQEIDQCVAYNALLNINYQPEVIAIYCDDDLALLRHVTDGLLVSKLSLALSLYESSASWVMEYMDTQLA